MCYWRVHSEKQNSQKAILNLKSTHSEVLYYADRKLSHCSLTFGKKTLETSLYMLFVVLVMRIWWHTMADLWLTPTSVLVLITVRFRAETIRAELSLEHSGVVDKPLPHSSHTPPTCPPHYFSPQLLVSQQQSQPVVLRYQVLLLWLVRRY